MKNPNDKGLIQIVIGGQYGSESKGLVVGELAQNPKVKYVVRTGSINAGHTVYYKEKAYAMEQIPVGWINPDVKLVIGAGAYVSPEILDKEIRMIEETTGKSLRDRLFIDRNAGSHLPKHAEASIGRHEKMGTVGTGCSAAIVDKIRRDDGCVLFKGTEYAQKNHGKHFFILDTVGMLNEGYQLGHTILIEGTQGTMLDLHMGRFPFTTSRQTIASAWLAEAGLSPNLNIEIIMVCRVYPIRVAGNSGSLPQETTWPELAKEINVKRQEMGLPAWITEEAIAEFIDAQDAIVAEWKLPNANFPSWTSEQRKQYSKELVNIHKEVYRKLPEKTITELRRLFEFTTVSKKMRRVAKLDIEGLKKSIMINRPDYLVLNFLEYKFPSLFEQGATIENSCERRKIEEYVKMLEEELGTPIKFVNWQKDKIHKIK